MHHTPRTQLFTPDPNDPALRGISLENYRKTIRSDTKECVVHQFLSNPEQQIMTWGEEPWSGESQFRVRERRERSGNPMNIAPNGTSEEPLASAPMPNASSGDTQERHDETGTTRTDQTSRSTPFDTNPVHAEETQSYGPV